MPAMMRSQVTYDQEATSTNVEGRFTNMEERIKKMALEMENLQQENEIWGKGTPDLDGVEPSQNDRIA